MYCLHFIDFTNSWKHATVDIRNMLRSVREGGSQAILVQQIQEMTETLDSQEEQITKYESNILVMKTNDSYFNPD